nr:hypothetical protein [uncultured Roseibium sp.]
MLSTMVNVWFGRKGDFGLVRSGVSPEATGSFSGMATLASTNAQTSDEAVLEAWRKELGSTPNRNDGDGDLHFLLLKNFLYWGSVALSLYLIFTVFSFF